MDAARRRKTIIEMLKVSNEPLKGEDLARNLGVSRQAIVHDIALIRASGFELVATAQGYIAAENISKKKFVKTLSCKHSAQDMEDELLTVVDLGGRVLDVKVEHRVYGELRGMLSIKSSSDVRRFLEKMKQEETPALSNLTGGVHMHTVEADSENILIEIEKKLGAKGYLYNKN